MSRTPLDPPAIVRAVEDLAALFEEANREHEAGRETTRVSLESYRRSGDALNRAKDQCIRERKPWLKELKRHFRHGERAAQQHMRLAREWDSLKSELDSDTGLARGLKMLVEDTGEAEEEEPEVRLPKYVTLDQWNECGEKARRRLLKPEESTDRFNNQGDNENIEWALWSWNPVTGCLHNCPYCYARDIANRFYDQKFAPSLCPSRLLAPQNTTFPAEKAEEWMGHKNVFTCSMADLFGRWVPREWIDSVLDAVRAAPQWNFLFLTKFPVRMAEFDFPDNAWVGTSVDCQARVANAEKSFRKVKAGVKWLSIEPMIEPLTFADLAAFDWIVLGGASSSSKTPEWHPPRRWIYSIEEQASKLGVRVYEKSNLWQRVRQYPGLEPEAELKEAPPELRYLPTPEHERA